MIKLVKNFILAVIAISLFIPVEIATIIVVAIKYGRGVFDYFDNVGLTLDILSAGRHRSLWNFLFVRRGGYEFVKGTNKSISRYLGINFIIRKLTPVGYVMYYLLYAIDVANWRKGGHCKNAVTQGDYLIIKMYE